MKKGVYLRPVFCIRCLIDKDLCKVDKNNSKNIKKYLENRKRVINFAPPF
jgi:hypothetical protein